MASLLQWLSPFVPEPEPEPEPVGLGESEWCLKRQWKFMSMSISLESESSGRKDCMALRMAIELLTSWPLQPEFLPRKCCVPGDQSDWYLLLN